MRKNDNKIVGNYDISSYTPILFWKRCECCGDLIRIESMWNVWLYMGRWGHIQKEDSNWHKYFCKKCFPTIQELIEYCNTKTK